MTFQIKTRQVIVNAIDLGNAIVLVDRHGRRLSSEKPLSEIEGTLSSASLQQWKWRMAVQRMMSRILARTGKREQSAWEKRTSSLAASLRLRRRFKPTKANKRQRFERFKTRTWRDACIRLWQQGDSRARRYSRNGWTKWAHTVSNNHNRRKGGKYGPTYTCNS